MKIFEGADVEAELAAAIAKLQKIQAKIDDALANSRDLLSSILAEEQRIAECEVLIGRYDKLSNQYKADIRRLSLIAEGEIAFEGVQQNTICPYCDGIIAPRKRQSYIASSKVELEKTITQLQGLTETQKDVEQEKQEILKTLENLKQRRTSLETEIRTVLRPMETSTENTIKAYKAYLRIRQEIEIIQANAVSFSQDITALEKEDEHDKATKVEYHPKEHYPDDFGILMSEYANSILRECNYDRLAVARFSIANSDIEVNGEDKARSHGKGYHSYLNTIVILMLRKYLAEHAVYNPGVFLIDTPLHGLDLVDDKDMPEGMRAGLYQYFMNHQDEGQLIVIENLNHIPRLDYEKSGVTVITFSKTHDEGARYGFLNIEDQK